jgi:hypothetical protein
MMRFAVAVAVADTGIGIGIPPRTTSAFSRNSRRCEAG